MKKLLLIPALMLGTASMAKQYDYEITPVAGYNIAEGNLGLENAYLVGGELQYNGFDSAIKPELSFLYSSAEQSDWTDGSDMQRNIDIYRMAVNGVYQFGEDADRFQPLIKAGLGYEQMSNRVLNDNRNSPYLNVGVGAKIPLMKSNRLSLKVEAVYESKYNDARYDSNLALLAGVTLAFGADDFKSSSAVDNSAEIEAANAKAAAAQAEAEAAKRAAEEAKAAAAAAAAATAALAAATADDDNDGVRNTVDKCPNTPAGYAVTSDGCMIKLNLHINFENASSTIDRASQKNAKMFVGLLKASPAYNVEIYGYTDSVGSEEFNKALSQRRADSVKAMLINKGIDSSRINAIGMGEANPVADNNTAAGRAENRRIEAKLIKTK